MRGLITRGKTIGIVISLLAASVVCIGQTPPVQILKDHTFSTNVGDYDALQINPSNIAAHWRPDKRVSFGLFSTNLTLFSRGIKTDLLHGGGMERLSEVGHWADEILVERNAVNLENTLLGINVNTKRVGCFAFSWRSNVFMETEINGVLEDIDFEGADFDNIGDIIMQTMEDNNGVLEKGDPSYVRMNMVTEFNLGYSRKVWSHKTKKIRVLGGGNLKYLLGYADIGLEFNGQEVAGYYALSSLLPEGWEDENIISQSQSDKKFGHGFGGSVGGSLIYDKWRAGLSFIDIGFMKWPTRSIYITQQDVVMEALTEEDMEKAVNDVLTNSQRNEKGMEWLPAKMVMGGSYRLHQYVSFYMDFVTPIVHSPKGMTNPTLGGGAWVSLKDILTLRTGATLVTKRTVTMPLYVCLFGGKNKSFEMGVGTTDFISFFKPTREYMNVQTAMMKFHF